MAEAEASAENRSSGCLAHRISSMESLVASAAHKLQELDTLLATQHEAQAHAQHSTRHCVGMLTEELQAWGREHAAFVEVAQGMSERHTNTQEAEERAQKLVRQMQRAREEDEARRKEWEALCVEQQGRVKHEGEELLVEIREVQREMAAAVEEAATVSEAAAAAMLALGKGVGDEEKLGSKGSGAFGACAGRGGGGGGGGMAEKAPAPRQGAINPRQVVDDTFNP
jgi:hypothetical protein